MAYFKNNIEIKKLMINYTIFLVFLMGFFYHPHLTEKCLDVIKMLYLISVIPLTVLAFISDESNLIWAKRILIYLVLMIFSLFLSNIFLYSFEHNLNNSVMSI